ncbi:MAG: hypothetical protein JXC36_09170 [Candidatus Atribacteria bacterium]|nr:hypothetical protein [Candidatus Atribacteria bacterium]
MTIPLSSKSESFYHKVMKELIYQQIKTQGNVKKSTKEKRIENNQADVFFQLHNGNKIAVEVQHSPKTVKDIIAKNKEYAENDTYVLWILHAKGLCIEDPKPKRNKKNIKISAVENFLHGMYGGRVYYIDFYENRKTISPPYALHFHCRKKRHKKPRKKGYKTYYIRDMYFSHIPSWNLVCNEFGEYKLARFFDKKYTLEKKRKTKKAGGNKQW